MKSTFKRTFPLQLLLLSIVLIGLRIGTSPAIAQTDSGSTTTGGASDAGSDSSQIIVLDSVNPTVLSLHLNHTIQATGIIENYLGDRSQYRFSMDDGSSVKVLGTFPPIGGTHWVLTARVVMDGPDYALSEIGKVPLNGSRPDPYYVAGSLLLVAALLTIVAMLIVRSRTLQKKNLEYQLEEERKRTASAQAAADEAVHAAQRLMETAASTRRAPEHTIISMGAIEVVSGPHTGQKFPLQEGETKIGRASDSGCAIVLDQDGEVSGYHGSVIIISDGQMVFSDKSRNGSVVDGKFVHQQKSEIHSGSEVELGGTLLRFVLRSGVRPSPQPDSQVGYNRAVKLGSMLPAVLDDQPFLPDRTMEPFFGDHTMDEIPMVDLSDRVSEMESRDQNVTPSPDMSELPAVTPSIQDVFSATPRPPTAPELSDLTMIERKAFLEAISGAESGRYLFIHQAKTTMGRENSDIVLSDASISRRHATLFVRGGQFVLQDDNSRHGTFVNGAQVGSEGMELHEGDLIKLGGGQTTLMFHEG